MRPSSTRRFDFDRVRPGDRIDNAALCRSLCDWATAMQSANPQVNGRWPETAQVRTWITMPEALGADVLTIIRIWLANPRFRKYHGRYDKEELASRAVLEVLLYGWKCDTAKIAERPARAFAYLSQAVKMAFCVEVRRVGRHALLDQKAVGTFTRILEEVIIDDSGLNDGDCLSLLGTIQRNKSIENQ